MLFQEDTNSFVGGVDDHLTVGKNFKGGVTRSRPCLPERA